MSLTEEQKKALTQFIMEITGLGEKDAEKVEQLIIKYPAHKIMVAINSMLQYRLKNVKREPISLEELERVIKRVRY